MIFSLVNGHINYKSKFLLSGLASVEAFKMIMKILVQISDHYNSRIPHRDYDIAHRSTD
jgi:hypothetical protein